MLTMVIAMVMVSSEVGISKYTYDYKNTDAVAYTQCLQSL